MPLDSPPSDHIICPYNKSHVIRPERIQFHLTKCEPTGDTIFVVCPFNSTHLIPSTEINNHRDNECPDRNKLDSFLYEQADVKPLFPVKQIDIDTQENWDNVQAQTYDPEKNLDDKKVLLLKQVVPPSERKRFHADQRKKFQSLPDDEVSVAKHNKLRLPNTKPITVTKETSVIKKAEATKGKEKVDLKPTLNSQLENLTISDKKSDEFELVVGKRNIKKKKTKSSSATDTTPPTQQKSSEKKKVPDMKKQPVLNEKNDDKKAIVNPKESVTNPSKESSSVVEDVKEDEFIVVTKKKNRSRKH